MKAAPYLHLGRYLGNLASGKLAPAHRYHWPFAEGDFNWISLCWEHGNPVWTCAFGDTSSGRSMPRHLYSLDGRACWPVRAIRAPRVVRQVAARVDNPGMTGVGTMAAVLCSARNPKRYYALSAAHVMAGNDRVAMDDRIVIDEQFDAKLANWLPVLGTGNVQTPIDAAVAEIEESNARALMQRYPLAAPTQTGALFCGGQQIVIQRKAGPLSAQFRGIWSGWVDVPDQPGTNDYWMEDGVVYSTSGDSTAPGDSGSALLDTQNRLVGVHCAGAPASEVEWNALGCPIDSILNLLGCVLAASQVAPPRTVVANFNAPDPVRAPVVGDAPATTVEDTLARTLWGEARGERNVFAAMEAIAYVVLNRAAENTWWGRNIVDVCRKPFQFSCWNRGDPNLNKLLRVDTNDSQFVTALEVARKAASVPCRLGKDATEGATHYYAESLHSPPSWARGKMHCARIGRHLFFKGIG